MLNRWIRNRQLRNLKRAGLTIADDCRINGWPIWGSEPYLITIGRRVTIAGGVVFLNHDGGTWVFRGESAYRNVIKYGRITIHDNCFIGYGAILLPGVEVGPDSVVAAGSVVTHTVPARSVAAGVPAKVIMDLDEYAQRALAATPQYDREAYQRDKRAELLRLYPPRE
jgi:acetyltransferase-like isoleucine patch superfamily enzyme